MKAGKHRYASFMRQGKKSFSIRKEVKFEGEEKWILRNEYKMAR